MQKLSNKELKERSHEGHEEDTSSSADLCRTVGAFLVSYIRVMCAGIEI
jgi:hypothetical protein